MFAKVSRGRAGFGLSAWRGVILGTTSRRVALLDRAGGRGISERPDHTRPLFTVVYEQPLL